MSVVRTATRFVGVTAAVAGLAVATAGVASATTAKTVSADNKVTVAFTLENGQVADTCTAGITPLAHAATVVDKLSSLDLGAIANDKEVTLLKANGVPAAIPSLIAPTVTVSAENVPSNVYALVSMCLSKKTPSMEPIVVGDPIQAATGSIGAGSSADTLAAGSSLLTKGMGA